MAEKVFVRQTINFETEFQAQDPHEEEGGRLRPVEDLHALTPYGMLLGGLGSCTALVVNTFARNHGLGLQQVELTLTYQRVFDEDCENCERIHEYHEHIEERIAFHGDLSEGEREKLFRIAHHCPIEKMLKSGVEVRSSLAEAA